MLCENWNAQNKEHNNNNKNTSQSLKMLEEVNPLHIMKTHFPFIVDIHLFF